MSKNANRIFAGGAIVLLGIAVVSIFYIHNTEPIAEGRQARIEQLSVLIGRKGGLQAYQQFGDQVASIDFNARHQQAHLFGAALYATEGLAGFKVCDAQFSYGCYHEFIGRAIIDHGPSVISELNRGCLSTTSHLTCQHGIGHGIAAYVGYEAKDLDKAIALCKTLPESDPIGGCYGGLFMEYNLRTMWGSDAQPRTYRKERPFEPCDTLKGIEERRACLYWQSQWWGQVLGTPSSEGIFKQQGDLCRRAKITYGVYRDCFEGIGNTSAPSAGFKSDRIFELCTHAGKTDEEVFWCAAVGANHLGLEVSVDEAQKVCARVAPKYQSHCAKWATNSFNIVDHE
ncbi:hypothetical protein EBR66_06235 [bacterium]|nr:hypothetical protein [bacterium]